MTQTCIYSFRLTTQWVSPLLLKAVAGCNQCRKMTGQARSGSEVFYSVTRFDAILIRAKSEVITTLVSRTGQSYHLHSVSTKPTKYTQTDSLRAREAECACVDESASQTSSFYCGCNPRQKGQTAHLAQLGILYAV